MRLRRVIKRTLGDGDGDVAGALHAVIAVNADTGGSEQTAHVSSHQRIVQRNGRTVVDESWTDAEPEGAAGADGT